MPLYEYQCTECGLNVDILRSMLERDDPAECKECSGTLLRIEMAGNAVCNANPYHFGMRLTDGTMVHGHSGTGKTKRKKTSEG